MLCSNEELDWLVNNIFLNSKKLQAVSSECTSQADVQGGAFVIAGPCDLPRAPHRANNRY